LTTDFNGDQIIDIILYGQGRVKAFQGQGDLTYQEVTNTIFPNDLNEVTSIVEFDYDNDGDFDLFLTKGKEFEIGETFYDEDTQIWGFFTKRGDFKFEDLEVGEVLNMENFQSQWPFNDAYYIGETGYDYEFSGETHSGKNIRLVNSDALGFPDQLKEEGGIHIGYIGNQKWRLAGSIWSPTTGIIHGVKSYPYYQHPKGLSDVLLENKKGKFVEVTKEKRLYFEESTTGATVADLDNNGFQDLIIARRGDLIHANAPLLYLNYGGAGFKQVQFHGIVSNDLGAIGMGIATLDYNLDGQLDILLGNERGKWHLFKNTSLADENYCSTTIEVGHSESGRATALGAIVIVETAKQQQIRRIGATGANYSLNANHFAHFGLGNCNNPYKVIVTWSNGEVIEQKVNVAGTKILIGKKTLRP